MTELPQLPYQCLQLSHPLDLFASGYWISQNCVLKTPGETCVRPARRVHPPQPLASAIWAEVTGHFAYLVRSLWESFVWLGPRLTRWLYHSQSRSAITRPHSWPRPCPPCVPTLKSSYLAKSLSWPFQPTVIYSFWNSGSLLLFHLALMYLLAIYLFLSLLFHLKLCSIISFPFGL